MRILRIRFQNLNSLRGEVALDFTLPPFTHSGLFAVTGDTGAGKTTILDAITLALFGKTSRNHDREVMSYGTTEAFAEVEFSASGEVFRAKWQQIRDKKGELRNPHREIARQNEAGEFIIEATGKTKLDGTKDEKGAVERLSGLNFEQFRRSVMLAQGEFAAFLQSDERERSALLERLTDTEIFTQLSRAAFERAKQENQRLADFERERQQLKVLDAEEVKSLRERKIQLLTAVEQLGKTLENLRQNQRWLEKLTRLEAKKSALETTAKELAEAKTALSPALAQLERHRLTFPFSGQVARVAEFAQEKISLENEQAEVARHRAEADAQASQLNQIFEEKKLAQQAAEQATKQLEIVLAEVVQLDEKLAARQTVFQKLETELVDFQETKRSAAEAEAAARQRSATAKTQISEAETWLLAHPAAQHLEKDLPAANERRDNLREIFRAKTEVEKALAEQRGQLAEAQNLGKKLAKKLDAAAAELATQVADFQQLLAENNLPAESNEPSDGVTQNVTPFSILNSQFSIHPELDRRAESAATTLQAVEDFHRHQTQYRQALAELDRARTEQSALQSESDAVGKDLLSLADLLDELQAKFHLKKSRLDRETAVLNLERERANLADGEPCPLCGSTEHPFRLHGSPDFVDDARAEFENVQNQLAETRAEQQQLSQRQWQIGQRLWAVDEEFEEATHAQQTQLSERIRQHEESIGLIVNNLDWGEEPAEGWAHSEFLLKKLAELQAESARWRAVREQAKTFSQKISQLERAVFEAKTNQTQQHFQVEKLVGEILGREKTQAELAERLATEAARLNQILEKHGLAFSPDKDFSEKFAQFEVVKSEFLRLETARVAASRELELAGQELDFQGKQLAKLEAELAGKQSNFDSEKTSLETLRTRRRETFGEKIVADERARAVADLEQFRLTINDLQTQRQSLAEHLAAAKSASANLEKGLAENARRTAEARAGIEKSLAKSGFVDVDSLLAAVLPEAVATDIETRQAELLKRQTELDQSRRETEAELTAERAKTFPHADLPTVNSELAAAENNHRQSLQNIGGIETQLAANEALSEQAAVLLNNIKSQKREVERWAKLRDLIGSADGAAFRRFAQSLTMQQLVRHANLHLEQLNGRYQLRRRAGSDLDLEVVDTYQADNVRGMNTLSGGETFLASLALALGLADFAGRKTRIQSLFIDEGFGALDENALEMAITTLENLQARGITIGIISHIRELKERIGVQVQVTKGTDGFSRVLVNA